MSMEEKAVVGALFGDCLMNWLVGEVEQIRAGTYARDWLLAQKQEKQLLQYFSAFLS
jgi:hypothetical protein